jgi:hypothetical protein
MTETNEQKSPFPIEATLGQSHYTLYRSDSVSSLLELKVKYESAERSIVLPESLLIEYARQLLLREGQHRVEVAIAEMFGTTPPWKGNDVGLTHDE